MFSFFQKCARNYFSCASPVANGDDRLGFRAIQALRRGAKASKSFEISSKSSKI